MKDYVCELSAEDEARAMLERAGVEGAWGMSGGDLVEIANMVAFVRGFAHEDVRVLRAIADADSGDYLHDSDMGVAEDCDWEDIVEYLAGHIEAMLPRRFA